MCGLVFSGGALERLDPAKAFTQVVPTLALVAAYSPLMPRYKYNLTLLCGEPERGFVPDLSWNHMAATELSVAHFIAGTLELGDDAATALLYRQPPVVCSVRDEDAGGAHLTGRCHKSRRERQNVR